MLFVKKYTKTAERKLNTTGRTVHTALAALLIVVLLLNLIWKFDLEQE